MKCPSCGYVHGWDSESINFVEGLNGDFYELHIKMEKDSDYHFAKIQKQLYACPACGIAFIEN